MIGNIVEVRDTRFIFRTNFAGDPAKDRFKDTRRKASLIIPPDLANDLIAEGFNVKQTQPSDEYDRPAEYYVNIIANYNSRVQPRIFLVNGNTVTKLDENTVGLIDDIRVENVNVILNPWIRDQFHSLYITTMYVEQKTDYDPFAEKYEQQNSESPEWDDKPF